VTKLARYRGILEAGIIKRNGEKWERDARCAAAAAAAAAVAAGSRELRPSIAPLCHVHNKEITVAPESTIDTYRRDGSARLSGLF
jgi:hypothetical protein